MKSSATAKTHDNLDASCIDTNRRWKEGRGELYTSLAHSEIFPINHGRLPVENRRGKIRISIFRPSDIRKRTTATKSIESTVVEEGRGDTLRKRPRRVFINSAWV